MNKGEEKKTISIAWHEAEERAERFGEEIAFSTQNRYVSVAREYSQAL